MIHDRYCDHRHSDDEGCNAFDCEWCGGNDWHGWHERWCPIANRGEVVPVTPVDPTQPDVLSGPGA